MFQPAAGPSDIVAPSGRRTLATIFLVYAMSVIDRQVLILLADGIRQDLGLSYVQIGLLLGTSFGTSYVFSSLVMGGLVDRVSRLPLLLVTFTVTGLTVISASFATTFAALLVSRGFLGIVQAPLPPAGHSILGDTFPRDRATLPLSIFALAPPIATSAALLSGGLLLHWAQANGPILPPVLGQDRPWQVVLLITGVASLCFAPLLLTLREPARVHIGQSSANAATGRVVRGFLRTHRRFFSNHFVMFSLSTLVSVNLMIWSPQHIQQRFGWSIAEAGAALALVSLIGSLAGGLIGGWLSDRMYRSGHRDAPMRISFWSFLAALPLIPIGFLSDSPRMFIACYFMVFAVTQNQGLASVALQLVTPARMRGRISSIYMAVTSIVSTAIAPPLIGALTQTVFRGDDGLAWALLTILSAALAAATAIAYGAGGSMTAAVDALDPVGGEPLS